MRGQRGVSERGSQNGDEDSVGADLVLDLCDVVAEQLAVLRLVAAEAVALEGRLQLRGVGGECRCLHVVGDHRLPLVRHAGEEGDGNEDDEEHDGEDVVEVGAVDLALHVALEREHEQQQDEKVDLGGCLQHVVLLQNRTYQGGIQDVLAVQTPEDTQSGSHISGTRRGDRV